MAEIINLRRARKARDRDAASSRADANRAKFGQTKAERSAAVRTQSRLDHILDGAKRDD